MITYIIKTVLDIISYYTAINNKVDGWKRELFNKYRVSVLQGENVLEIFFTIM